MRRFSEKISDKSKPHKKASRSLYRIQVLDRAVSILKAFTFERCELSVSEVGAATGLHKSTAHRILTVLEQNGMIEKNVETVKYHLGIQLFTLGHKAIARLNLRDIARPHLKTLMEETRETVHLALLVDSQIISVEKVEGPHALHMPSRVGRYIPAHSTALGKAVLSCLEVGQVNRIIKNDPFRRFTPNTVRGMQQLIKELEVTRKRGYAIDDEETEVGLRCVAAPIRDCTGEMIYAISVSGPSPRLVPKRIPLVAKLVVKGAAAISSKLGFDRGEALTGS
jgi:DNA-binding IclR family transcriptional regulator